MNKIKFKYKIKVNIIERLFIVLCLLSILFNFHTERFLRLENVLLALVILSLFIRIFTCGALALFNYIFSKNPRMYIREGVDKEELLKKLKLFTDLFSLNVNNKKFKRYLNYLSNIIISFLYLFMFDSYFMFSLKIAELFFMLFSLLFFKKIIDKIQKLSVYDID